MNSSKEQSSPNAPPTVLPVREFSPNKELAYIGFVLLVYFLIQQQLTNALSEGGHHLAYLIIAPSLWLLVATAFWVRRFASNSNYFHAASKACWMAGIAALIITLLLCLFGEYIMPTTVPSTGFVSNIRTVANLVILVPFAEEYFFRGLVFDHLVRNLGKFAGVILVSALFAFMHAPQGIYIQMFIFSVLLCLVTLKAKNVLPGTVIHLVWNLIVFYHHAGKGL